ARGPRGRIVVYHDFRVVDKVAAGMPNLQGDVEIVVYLCPNAAQSLVESDLAQPPSPKRHVSAFEDVYGPYRTSTAMVVTGPITEPSNASNHWVTSISGTGHSVTPSDTVDPRIREMPE